MASSSSASAITAVEKILDEQTDLSMCHDGDPVDIITIRRYIHGNKDTKLNEGEKRWLALMMRARGCDNTLIAGALRMGSHLVPQLFAPIKRKRNK